jgi:hypothetical protein
MGITEEEYKARFCDEVEIGWRLKCTPRRKPEAVAAA